MKLSFRTGTVLFALFCILVPALASCGLSGSSGSGGNTVLSIEHIINENSPNGQVFQQILHDFGVQNHVTIHQTIAASDATTQYETSLVAGKEADVVFINLADKTTSWLQEGATIDVNSLAQQWGITKGMLPEALKEWTTPDGKLQAFPYNGFKWPVWYNMDMLKSVGFNSPPTTIDQLITLTGKLRAAGKGPVVVGGNDWSGNKLFMQIMQSYLTDSEARSVFQSGNYCANPDAQKGIELFVRLRDSGVFVDSVAGISADQMNSAFYTGQAAIMPAGSWAFSSTPANLVPHVYLGGWPLPSDAKFDHPTAYQGYTSMGIWISPNGQKKLDLVQKFVQYMFSQSVIAKQVAVGTIPTISNVPVDDKANPLLAQATNQLDQRVSYPLNPDLATPGNVVQNLTRATSLAYGHNQSVSSICQALKGAYQ